MNKTIFTIVLLALSSAAAARGGNAIDELDIEVVPDRGARFEVYPLHSSSRNTFRAYLEAVPQAHYSIRVRNRGPHRIGVVIAVDGRNIISGRRSELEPTERMYVLGPWESATYSGWRTSGSRVNRFYFTDVEDSYSAAFGDYSAMGVIAAAAFREQPRPQRHRYRQHRHNDGSAGGRLENDKAAPQGAEKGSRAQDAPGTGYGADEWSPSRRVEFEPERHAFARYFLKYEWRDTLCEKGIRDCYRDNRFWNDRRNGWGFAPPPPKRRWFSRWHW